jgi:hypothetical protein
VRRPTGDGRTRVQVAPLPADRVPLADWSIAYDTAGFEAETYPEDTAEVMSLEDWYRQLHLYGGAPPQVMTPSMPAAGRSTRWGTSPSRSGTGHATAMLGPTTCRGARST